MKGTGEELEIASFERSGHTNMEFDSNSEMLALAKAALEGKE